MFSSFFGLNDLTINLPPTFDLKSIDTLDGFKTWDSFQEEILHHYFMLSTPQGILMALLRVGLLTLLGASILKKNNMEGQRLIIPLAPFYASLSEAFKGLGTIIKSKEYKHISVNGYDVLVAMLMNLNEYLYGHMDIDTVNIPPRLIRKTAQLLEQHPLMIGSADRETPVLEICDTQGNKEKLPWGFHGIMEGYARTQTNILLRKVAESNTQLRKEFNRNYNDQISRCANLPHYLSWQFVKTHTGETDSNTSLIVAAVSYISLLHCGHISMEETPSFFRDASHTNLEAIYKDFERFIHPGITFFEALGSLRRVLRKNSNRAVDIVDLVNMTCDDMEIERPEIMLSKTKTVLIKLLQTMDPVYKGPGFLECIAKMALDMLNIALRDIRKTILGFQDIREISVLYVKGGAVFTNNPIEHVAWCGFVSLLDQILNSDKIVCFPKYMNEENTLCSNSANCSKTFTPSELCEKGFIEWLGFIGNYKNIQSKWKAF